MPVFSSWATADRAKQWRNTEMNAVRQGDVTREVDDDPVSIVLYRGGVAQAAQTVRLLQPGNGREMGSVGGEEARADLIVLGGSTMDVQREDTFQADSKWYRIIYVTPGQLNRTEAGAIQVQ